jgi:hypothetical protein
MKKITLLILTVFLILSCKKEKEDTRWERTFGQGNAFFVQSSPDSGIIACGTLDNKPYLIKLSRDRGIEADYKSGTDGLFSSAWPGKSFFIAGGISGGKMLLARIDDMGSGVWDTMITAGFEVGLTDISYTGDGTFLAVGSPGTDQSDSGTSGLLFIRFDTEGNVNEHKEIIEIRETEFVSAQGIYVDSQGNIFLPLTRRTTGEKARAGVAKFNSDFEKLWETELSNNPNFAASATGITVDGSGNTFVTGGTEVSRESGTYDNSYLASLDPAGSVRWKKYLEIANTGSDLILTDDALLMLNRKCFVVNMADPDDGTEAGRILMFEGCDSYDTDVIGSGIDLHYDGNILVAGEKGGSFYLAMKPAIP